MSATWAGFASLHESNICKLKIMIVYLIVISGLLVQLIFVREMTYVFGNVSWGISGVFWAEFALLVVKGRCRMTPGHNSGNSM